MPPEVCRAQRDVAQPLTMSAVNGGHQQHNGTMEGGLEHTYHPRSILLTGGAGFIGSFVVIRLATRYPHVRIVVLDKVRRQAAWVRPLCPPFSPQKRAVLGTAQMDYCSSLRNLESVLGLPNVKFLKGDIQSMDLLTFLLKAENVDTVMHFAAQVRYYYCAAGRERRRGSKGCAAASGSGHQARFEVAAPCSLAAVRPMQSMPTCARPRGDGDASAAPNRTPLHRRTWTTALATPWPSR